MIVTTISDFDLIKKVRTKYIVRIFFDRKRKNFESFWLSEKQYKRLNDCFHDVMHSGIKDSTILCVFDSDRFVWAGVEYPDISDREWLEHAFKAEYSDHYYVSETIKEKHTPKRIEPTETQPDADLIR